MTRWAVPAKSGEGLLMQTRPGSMEVDVEEKSKWMSRGGAGTGEGKSSDG
jgi:hypothetical protein